MARIAEEAPVVDKELRRSLVFEHEFVSFFYICTVHYECTRDYTLYLGYFGFIVHRSMYTYMFIQ